MSNKAGGKRPGAGRPKGSITKYTLEVKQAFLDVFNKLQEDAGGNMGHLLEWAGDHPTEFYKLCGKMIPQAVQVDANVNHRHDVDDYTDDELLAIAARSHTTDPETEDSETKSDRVH